MKKLLTITLMLLLILPLMASCFGSGKKDGGEGTDDDDVYLKSQKEVIKASSLISLADASALVGEEMEKLEPLGKFFADELTLYPRNIGLGA